MGRGFSKFYLYQPMKIDRVILSSNNNPNYYHFWNVLAPVYRDKFGIKPTLMWFGTREEMKECGIDTSLGDVWVQNPHKDYHIPWQTTWGLFFLTKYYPDDVCLIIGIDQIPLSGMFIRDMIDQYSNDDYVMLIADAYKPTYWSNEGGASPSSYHIAKGRTFNNVYGFAESWMDEADKVGKSGIAGLWENTEGRWGIDESYSCHMLRQYKGSIVSIDGFRKLEQHRIECNRHIETHYETHLLQQGWYSESHLCRPYTNHKAYIDRMLNLIPKCL